MTTRRKGGASAAAAAAPRPPRTPLVPPLPPTPLRRRALWPRRPARLREGRCGLASWAMAADGWPGSWLAAPCRDGVRFSCVDRGCEGGGVRGGATRDASAVPGGCACGALLGGWRAGAPPHLPTNPAGTGEEAFGGVATVEAGGEG